jgi:chemotaxis methyl-accepting protein methylase/nitrogen fixation/metabolism regulation signal transduction histidine kinase
MTRRKGSPKTRRPGAAAGGPRRALFPIVGIGASAGGLEAFKKFFTAMPAEGGVAFVLIQHLDPTRRSLTADLVSTYTRMGVVQVEDGMRVEVNRVHVIPPNTYLSIRHRALHLSAPSAPRGLRMAVDWFLRSLAEEQQDRAIGILLSGTGTDGTLGLKEIKAAGGMTMVQDPTTVQHDGMPRSAITSGCADYVLPAEQMADVLLTYVRHTAATVVGTTTPSDKAPDTLASVLALLHARTAFDFSDYRKGTLQRRIQRRMSLQRLGEMTAYLKLLERDPVEVTALFKDLLINVTSFFREPAAWQILQEQVVRPLVAAKDANTPLRIWVPACATGEEAYSIAMVAIEERQANGRLPRAQIFASDVDAEVLDTARAGVYPEGIAAQVSPERLSRFFIKSAHSYQVTKELREAVVFAQQSLITDPPFSKLDVVSCRNLLIYLEPAVQERILALLHFALGEGGYLFLGSAETIGPHADLFEAVSTRWRIFRRIGPTRHAKLRLPVVAPAPRKRARPPSEPTPDRLATMAEQMLLQRYAPACAIIDRSGEVLYYHGRTGDYLAQPGGPPTQDIVAKARDGLGSKLRGAIQDAIQEHRRVVATGVQMRRGEAFPRVTITVEPLDTPTGSGDAWLVSFEDTPAPPAIGAAAARSGRASGHRDPALVGQLRYELKTTQEDLQKTVEDVSAANEELMSVNEELQASNEELETSKEELQSLNEELTTANTQLESKIAELEAANNDLDNLLTSTNIATLFLDTHLRVRRFTPAATALFSLISSDIGRPLADIAQKFTDPTLLSDAVAVLRETIAPEREVQTHDGRWYVRQILPYRTRANQTEGVVITFSDVAAQALQEARLYAESIVDTVREPLLVLDGDLQVLSANRSFYATFLLSKDETVGRSLYALGDGDWEIPQLQALLGEVLPRQRVLNDFEVAHEFAALGPRNMLLNARTLHRGGGRPDLILVAIEDVTERRRALIALRELEDRKHLEDEVRRRQAALAHALRISTVGELASGLAHELNQPLAAIANGMEACMRYVSSGTTPSSKLLELLEDASTEALRAGSIVEHLRGFIEKGEPQLEPTDLSEIARGVPLLLAREVEQRRITFRLDVPPQPLRVYADRIQIEQIMVNLIQNAMEAVEDAPEGRHEIHLRAGIVNDRAEVAVRDTGTGVSVADEERMFEPFFTTKKQGMGMGLAISRSILEAHQGRIWLERPADGTPGTTIRFALPLHTPKSGRRRRTP